MIKLFEFQKKEIRTENIDGKLWFSGADVFSVLGLAWRGVSSLNRDRQITDNHILKKGIGTNGGIQELIFIDEQALYKITFRANKSELADEFTDWVAELLVKIRESVSLDNTNDLRKHLNITVQKDFSNKINALNFENGGVTKTIDYNVKNCQLHTNQKPYQIVQMGKDLGLKSKQTTSAKEVIRALKPELACSMSFTDKLVSENGVEHNEAARISINFAQPLFGELIQLGFNQRNLE